MARSRLDDVGRTVGAQRAIHIVALALACMLGGGGALANEQAAKAILKSMSDYMAGQKTLTLTFDSDIEVITPQMEKIQFASSGRLEMIRPDKLRAHRVGGYSDVELVYDGKSAVIHSKTMNAYFQAEAVGTIDGLVTALRAGHGVALPGGDYLLSRPYDVLVADVIEAKHLGVGVIDGVRCEHLAFRNIDTDWQVWVEAGARPFPRKVVITSKTVGGAPQYTLRIKSWTAGAPLAADTFAFRPPPGAAKLAAEDLVLLDELPQGAAAQ